MAYRVTAAPGFPHAIHSIATVAGAIGKYTTDTGFVLHRPEDGTPTNALLVQGSQDPRHPERGGLDSNDEWESLSHLHKVDLWRTVTGTDASSGVAVDLQVLTGTALPAVTATNYANGTSEVTDIVDANLEHSWPSWDLMAVIVDFFNRI